MTDNHRKRAAEERDTNKDSTVSIDSTLHDFRVRDIMQCINSIQNTLANFTMRLDEQGRDLDDLTKEVRKKNGIDERLENVQEQANDTLYTISELQDRQKNMEREMKRLRDYVIRLEFQVKTQNNQIIELKAKSMENNIIVSGVPERNQGKQTTENLPETIRNVFISEMEIERSIADNLGVLKVFRLGEYHPRRKFPRPNCVQFTDKSQKEVVMNSVKVLKSKRSAIRVAQQLPEEMREKRKQLFEIQKKYSERQIETKVKGDKLVFTQSNSVYRDKVGSRPTADEVITPDEVNVSITSGKSIEDNGNRFLAHSTPVDSFKPVRKSLLEVMRLDSIPSASHNIYAYRFTGNDGISHEGSDDDGEHGAGRALLIALKDNEIENSLVVVSRWFGGKIGPRTFTHVKTAGLSAVKTLQAR
ncbi:uncharacterized protein LOC130047930 [Ostrea edulis]|uniref:uncharacterized protein LOC130047930 n=1 Tax=Ostrea edulis TaxID=37623 RepID=UPI0024AF1532|nr:uncharacterized protein LOC130047930 [Ostrea edulis]